MNDCTVTPVGPLQDQVFRPGEGKENYSKTSEMRDGTLKMIEANTARSARFKWKHLGSRVVDETFKILRSLKLKTLVVPVPLDPLSLSLALEPSKIVKTVEGVLNNICKIFADVPCKKEFRLPDV